MTDTMQPTFITMDAAGRIGAVFTGKIVATGLDLTAALGNVTDVNEIRWLRASDSIVVAHLNANILGTQGGAGADYSGNLDLVVSSVGNLTSAVARMLAISDHDANSGSVLEVVSAPGNALGDRHQALVQLDDDAGIGVHEAVVLDGTGRSNFQQVFDGTQGALALISRRLARNFGPMTSAQFTTLAAAITPVDGDEVTLLVDNSAGTEWRFRYNSAAGAAVQKWQFCGGTPMTSQVNTLEQLGVVGAFSDLATLGPRITVPRTGAYQVNWGHYTNLGSAQTKVLQSALCIGASAVAVSRIVELQNGAGASQIVARQNGYDFLSLTAGDDLRVKYLTTLVGVNAPSWADRWLTLLPVRIQ